MHVRTPQPDEIELLAEIWFDGWRDAHAAIVPEELARVRTVDNFRDRLPDLLPETRVVGDVGAPLGFSITKDDELYQLYVSADARGKGVAQKLIAEVEERLAARGYKTAWLACAIGNDRAARFYEKSGWHNARTFVSELPVPNGPFFLEVWRYEKDLSDQT
jgi:ribosomal protein S18 acetylase RimI-like enzyme